MSKTKTKGQRQKSLPFIIVPKIKSKAQAAQKIAHLHKLRAVINEEIELLKIASLQKKD